MASNRHTDEVFTQKRKPKNPIKFQLQLNDEQKLAKALIVENPVVILKGMAGSGKAQPLDSLVLTPNGYTTMGSLQIGDNVSTPDGRYATVVEVFPQGVKQVFEMTFSDGSSTLCCKEHLWNVQHRNNKHTPKRRNGYKNNNHDKWQTYSVEQILDAGVKNSRGLNNWYIPITSAVSFNLPEIAGKIDPYLLGALLGDGHLGIGSITLSTVDSDILHQVQQICNNMGVEVVPTGYGCDYRLTTKRGQANPLLDHIKQIGLIGHTSTKKFIPEQYLLQSVEDRLALLQGLLDTDGGVESSAVCFNTTSQQLAKDVQFLVNSLGGTTTSRQRRSKLAGKETGTTCFTVTIKLPNTFTYFRLRRKQDSVIANKKQPSRSIKSIELVGDMECQCILIDSEDHLYLTDSMIVTHNTLVAVQAALDMLFCREVEKIIITRPTVAKEELGFLPGDLKEKMDPWLAPIYHNLYMLYGKDKVDKELENGNIEIVPFAFMRGRTFVNSFVIVDEAQNVTQDQMETVLGRLGKGSKMVICGDLAQIDLKVKKETGFSFLTRIEEQVEGFRIFALKQNHRHEIVSPILKVYQDFRD